MKSYIKVTVLFVMVMLFGAVAIADDKAAKPAAKLRDPAEFEKIIDDYKAFVATVTPELRDEIITYRKSISSLNQQKKVLYKKLSQEGQNYLKKEQEYKKKLPLNRKSLISVDELNKSKEPTAHDKKKN
ncbi:MAG: hypothetical protein AB8B66_03495 [Rickettsiaceae bacterium]